MTIVVGVDGSSAARHALSWAVSEARRRRSSLRLVHAWTFAIGGHAAPADTLLLLADASQALLDGVVCEARAGAPDLEIAGTLVQHAPARALLVESAGAELLVVGSRGHGALSAFFVGSVADACVRHATVPVAVVRPEADEHPGAVVVGVDGSAASIEALRWAREEARLRGAGLVALHAWQPEYSTELAALAGVDHDAPLERAAHDVVEHALEATAAADGVEVQARVVRAVPGAALVDASRDAALLVVGSRGRGGFVGLLLGSVSRRCLHAAACPVVVVGGAGS